MRAVMSVRGGVGWGRVGCAGWAAGSQLQAQAAGLSSTQAQLLEAGPWPGIPRARARRAMAKQEKNAALKRRGKKEEGRRRRGAPSVARLAWYFSGSSSIISSMYSPTWPP